jgi:Flp pilus assembly protein TadB
MDDGRDPKVVIAEIRNRLAQQRVKDFRAADARREAEEGRRKALKATSDARFQEEVAARNREQSEGLAGGVNATVDRAGVHYQSPRRTRGYRGDDRGWRNPFFRYMVIAWALLLLAIVMALNGQWIGAIPFLGFVAYRVVSRFAYVVRRWRETPASSRRGKRR